MKSAVATVLAGLAGVCSAEAGELTPEQARHFIAEKAFSYNCFDGTVGTGRIRHDGSVFGTMRPKGVGPLRFISLPVGTVKVTSNSICATLNNSMFQPCFKVNQTSPASFRGSLTLLSFAYCDFKRLNSRRMLTAGMPIPRAPRIAKGAGSATATAKPVPITPVTAETLPPAKPPAEAAAAAPPSVDLRPSKN